MKKKSIVVLVGSIGAILAIFAAVFVFLQDNPDAGEKVNTIGIVLFSAGILTALIAAVISARRNKR
ncbi:hypothetical protein [Amycolatopsis orientalis]|uniref:hypothetical protein n=1 Tax=Amycolatopsis orientalis TaxID=31958 RepID=UPI001319CE2C|nr:hypothetical protein [Amycolatopsis orientalis]